MHRAVWLTDLHLNHCQDDYVETFFDEVKMCRPDSILVTGDFSESFQLLRYLRWMDAYFDCPIYFVLGNHDYYFSMIGYTRLKVEELCREHEKLVYLTTHDPVRLTDRVGLIGHDGWADGRIGDFERSMVMMHDYQLIDDLSALQKTERWEMLKKLGDEAAEHVRAVLPKCLAEFDESILLTHVPPLREACWHEGQISDDEWAPHFTCKAMGDVILEIMPQYPDKKLMVYCGHTHGSGTTEPLPNVRIVTGGAIYGKPAVSQVLELNPPERI